MYIGELTHLAETEMAYVLTVEGPELDGRSDYKIFLPKSQCNLRRTTYGQLIISIPDWIIEKNHINFNRIKEIRPA